MKSGLVLSTFLLLIATANAADGGSLASALLSFYSANSDSARAVIESYAEAHPESDSAWYYLGRVHFEDGEYKQAAKSFEQATDLTEGSSLFHLWLARTYGQRAIEANLLTKGRYANKFKDHVDLAIEFDPDNLDAREDRLGKIHEAVGDTETAIQAYRTAVELDSTNQWAREALNELASP
ncbi:tetratricopeptide repeat protein [bacterium]|nr:tetratricopeptide repeat protein [bacterium]